MKICKVRPDRSTCSACIATQEMFNVVDDCSKCKLNTDIYELLQRRVTESMCSII
jgi:hypothetical protein